MPKVLVDTSIVIAALVDMHPRHRDALPYLDNAHSGTIDLKVSTHCLAEAFSSLTVLRAVPRLTPERALHLLEDSLVQIAEAVPLDLRDYEHALNRMVGLGLVSGAIYDALHVRAAEKAGCDELVTLNGRDFQRMPPNPPTRLVVL